MSSTRPLGHKIYRVTLRHKQRLQNHTEGDTRIDGSLYLGFQFGSPVILRIEWGAKVPNSFDKSGTSDALEIIFPFKIMQGRRILPAVTKAVL